MDIKKYFNEIKERTGANNSSNSEILDYKNGYSISIDEIEKEYKNYIDLCNEIELYIDVNNLDDIDDKNEIINNFKDIEDCFKINQAVLKDFVEYMIIKINKNL